jgi:hypothetical protein
VAQQLKGPILRSAYIWGAAPYIPLTGSLWAVSGT